MTPIALSDITLGGEFGRRVNQIIDANILKIDLDATFLNEFRNRGEGGYLGFGKFIDACVRLAASTKNPQLLAMKKKLIADLIATQDADGYIGTVARPEMRIKALWDLHENAYIIYALVSDFEFNHEAASLKAGEKMADYMLGLFGKDPAIRPDTLGGVVTFWGSNLGFDRALIALSRATKNPKYRDFAINFLKIKEYGPEIHTGPSGLANHAYTYMGHTLAQLDLYRENPDVNLLRAAHSAVDFMRKHNGMLITGSCSEAECWHDTQSGLQNTAETCMSAYLARIMDAMLQIEGASLYGDIMERDIYNALFSATSPEGDKSRYFTPFEGKRRYDDNGNRFCCANNNKRFLADLPGWIYYRTADGIAVNLYNESSLKIDLASNLSLQLEQHTDYPTEGNVGITVRPSRAARFTVRLRIPRWCKQATVAVNNEPRQPAKSGEFHIIDRAWNPGDTIQLRMPMQFRFIRGRASQVGRAAILRGPVLFTLNPQRNPDFAAHPDFSPRELMFHPDEIQPAAPDASVRPNGIAATINAWTPGHHQFWPHIPRKPLTLTEYPDAGGQNIYFLVPNPESPKLEDDELVAPGV